MKSQAKWFVEAFGKRGVMGGFRVAGLIGNPDFSFTNGYSKPTVRQWSKPADFKLTKEIAVIETMNRIMVCVF
jgi:hypothetical protein